MTFVEDAPVIAGTLREHLHARIAGVIVNGLLVRHPHYHHHVDSQIIQRCAAFRLVKIAVSHCPATPVARNSRQVA